MLSLRTAVGLQAHHQSCAQNVVEITVCVVLGVREEGGAGRRLKQEGVVVNTVQLLQHPAGIQLAESILEEMGGLGRP